MAPMTPDLSRRRFALFAFFFIPGLIMASWITRTPAIRDSLGVSLSEMGLILFGISLGAMTGILCAGKIVRRFGTKPITFTGLWLIILGATIMGLGLALSSVVIVTVGFFLLGFGMGISEIAINIDGADVERLTKLPLLHALHGCFSLGTVAGALGGIALTAWNFPVSVHLWIVSVLCIPPIFLLIGSLPEGLGKGEPHEDATASASSLQPVAQSVWKDIRLILIGGIVLAVALAEGAANDWLPLLMVDEHGFDPASGSLIFLGFAAMMTVGRFGGGYFLRRYGRTAVIRGSAISGALGLALVIFSTNPIIAGFAVLFWGLGASLGFPVALSAAGDSGSDPATRVRIVATIGYVAFLVGPPTLGFVGEHYGLRNAMLIVLILVALAAFIAPAVRGTSGKAESAH